MYALTSSLLGVTAQDFARGDVVIALIHITHRRDARSKGPGITEAAPPAQ